eukprot:1156186-Pelagomonas_calceolata.AAC.6
MVLIWQCIGATLPLAGNALVQLRGRGRERERGRERVGTKSMHPSPGARDQGLQGSVQHLDKRLLP